MKKFRFAALLAAAVLCLSILTACSGNNGQPSGGASAPDDPARMEAPSDLLSQIQDRGEIVVAMEGTWAPWTYHDENDQLVGYDVEVGGRLPQRQLCILALRL